MKKSRLALVLLIGMSLAFFSCGKEKEQAREAKKPKTDMIIAPEKAPLKDVIESSGFKVALYRKFPSEEISKKGRVILYQAEQGSSGGVIYLKRTGDKESPCWHWYFKNSVPDGIEPIEINEDGLWDIRVTTKGGKSISFIQDKDFTMMSPPREDLIALNGTSSPPSSDENELWKCFDGDSLSAFRTSVKGEGAFIDLYAPFGIRDGILTVQTLDKEQPRKCEIYADGKKIDELKLKKKSGKQMVHINTSIQGAKSVRLVFKSSYDSDGFISIVELALK